MRQNPSFTLASEEGVKRLIREHPWMTIVSMTDAAGLVASHYPVLLDETADGIVLLTHVGRPDEVVHELGRHEVMVIVQGPHGYISPGWYDANPAVPTWNFVTAHLLRHPRAARRRREPPRARGARRPLRGRDARAAAHARHRRELRLRRPHRRRAPWGCASRSPGSSPRTR